jgi:hypothetical protein
MSLSQKATTVRNSNGCYATSSSSTSIEKCLGTCLTVNSSMLQRNGVQCFCGNEVAKSGSLGSQPSVGECSTKCPGTLSLSGAVGPSVF